MYLVIGDPHFKVDNMPEVNEWLRRLYALIEDRKPDVIVVLGDVLHTHERLHTEPLNKAIQFFTRLGEYAKTYVLVGNHDMISNQEFLNTQHWMNCAKTIPNVNIVDKPCVNDRALLVPYVPPGRFSEALQGFDVSLFNVIFAHQEFRGCKMGAIVSVDGDEWPEDAPFVISGHIHSNQRPQSNVYYPGSALQVAYGESEKNIVALVDEVTSTPNIEEVDLGMPRKQILYKTADDMEAMNKSTAEELKNKKITLTGTKQELEAVKKTKEYKELMAKGAKLVFKPIKERIDAVEGDFETILRTLVEKERNPFLTSWHEKVVYGRDVSPKDVLYV